MRQRTKFSIAFLLGSGSSPELMGAFALGLFVVAILGNLAYDLLMAPADSLAATWRPVIAAAFLTALAYWLYWRDRQRKPDVQVDVDESRLAPPHAGLIWLFGPGRFDHLLFALEHHRERGGAAHCWLVMQNIEPVREAYGQLSQQLLGQETKLHPFYVEELDVQATYQAVRTIVEREATEAGLTPEQVIADVTGGPKPMTTGMVLAALTHDSALEYVESERDTEGNPIPGTQRVVLVDTTFYVTRGE